MDKIKNPMDMALSAIPEATSVAEETKNKSTVKVSGTSVQSGWGVVATSTRLTYHSKPNPDDWNQVDLQWYLKNRYSDKYGVTLHIPIANGHNWISTIKLAMSKKMSGVEPKHSVVKDYFDFCIDKHLDEIIRSEGNFSLYKLTKPKYIGDYFDNRIPNIVSPQPKMPIVDFSTDLEALTIVDLTASYRINPEYMVKNYGIIIPINFLISVKRKSVQDAISYVQGAMAKLKAKGSQEFESVLKATKKYEPYPSWLQFVDVMKVTDMTIALSNDNPVFKELKEQK